MSALTSSSLLFDSVSLVWEDGTAAVRDVSGAFGTGRTGLVGRNGSGQSTLLRLAAGELPPTAGRISRSGEVAYPPQRLTLGVDRPAPDPLRVTSPPTPHRKRAPQGTRVAVRLTLGGP